jgi:hypothetical protein
MQRLHEQRTKGGRRVRAYKSPAGAGIFMNQDMAERQIEPDSLVELESVTEEGDVRRTMAVSTHPSEMLTLRQIAGRLVSF